MLEEFYDRISLKSDLSKLSKIICQKYNVGKYISEEIILVGYEEKGKYLNNKYNKIFKSLIDRITNVKFAELPTSFVHGDIISSNVMKDSNNKLWIIDFAVSNYLPRIVDLAVTSCNLCLNPKSQDKTIKSTKMILTEYQKYNKLTDYELECFPLFYDLANAMGILQISYLSNFGKKTEEDDFWLQESEKGLSFSTLDFWKNIINK